MVVVVGNVQANDEEEYDFDKVVEIAKKNLSVYASRYTASIHSNNKAHNEYAETEL